ncbi:unnamed protein product, partial [marine sediment metagenome]
SAERTAMGTVLVVDDDRSVLDSIAGMISDHGHQAVTAGRAEEAFALLDDDGSEHKPDAIILDIRMPGINGLEALRHLRETRPEIPVVIMTAYATMEAAVEAMKLGAYDYHTKPFDPEAMLRTVDDALECVRMVDAGSSCGARGAVPTSERLIGHSPAMQEIYKAIGRVAQTSATVLIRGETGVGKELVARAIHEHSHRRDRPLVVVNCAALPETLLESELFGHEKGSFTGAGARQTGRFEQAEG